MEKNNHAVNQAVTPPTAEQVAAALLIIEQSSTILPDRTTVLGESTPAPLVQHDIPEALVAKLTALFTVTMANPDFFKNPKRAVRLEDALVVPMFEDRSMQQFAISAREELTKQAMDTAIENNAVPVKPTDEQITALAVVKYEAKQLKDAERAAKKKA